MTSQNQVMVRGVGQAAQGFYKVMVVDSATEQVVYESPWGKNLILNQGMDHVATALWCDCFTFGCCGTGTRPNSVDSVTDTAAQSGTTVTNTGASVNFTTDAAIGDMIRWDSGSEARVTGVTDATHVEVTPSQTVGSGQYTIWKTSQTGLQTEVTGRRNQNYLAGAGNCETNVVGTSVQSRRTFDFATESGPATYTEVGVAWAGSLSSTVFSRILLASPVALISGQKLRLVYQLNVTVSPSTPTSKNLPVGGWPVAPSTDTDGQECIQTIGMSAVQSNGTTTYVNGDRGWALEPGCPNSTSNGRLFALSTSSTALQAFGTAASRATTAFLCTVAPTNATYNALDFKLDVSSVFQVADAVSNNLRSLMVGHRISGGSNWLPYDTLRQSFVFLFGQDQVKTNTQTLTFTVRYTWTRVLA